MSPLVTPLVTTTGPEDLAHLVHYGIVAAGVAGVTALLLPAFLERARPATHTGDEHDRRVRELRDRAAHGTLTRPASPAVRSPVRVHDVPDEALPENLYVPVVVVSSLAAAGVHAAVAPPHLEESLLVGSFFVVCALAQLAWAGLARRHPTPVTLWLGIVGNLAVLTLWLVSRTVGVPGLGAFGLTGPEPVGPWDLTCALWEVVIVVGCLRLRRVPVPGDRQPRGPYHPFVLFWLVLSVLALGLLSVSGAHA